MNQYKEELNTFLVEIFHDILRLEETALAKDDFKNLSVHEMHVIEAVYDGNKEGLYSMSEIAARLMVTASTLTTSVKTLEQKGYLKREKQLSDKRFVKVCPTDLGLKAYSCHKDFHQRLVDRVSEQLKEEELRTLTTALSTLHQFFQSPKEDQ